MERNHKKITSKRKNSKGSPLEALGRNPRGKNPFHFFLFILSSFSFFFLSLIPYGPRGLKAPFALVWSTNEAWGGIKTPACHLNRHTFFFKIFKGPVDRYLHFRSTGWPIFQIFEKSSRLAIFFPSNALYDFYPFSFPILKLQKF